MAVVLPALDRRPGHWLFEAGVDWWDLVRYGPPGFDAYLRIALTGHDAHGDGDAEGQVEAFRIALATLAGHTTTPATAYAAIWEGWTSGGTEPEAPRLPIPHRTMLLFTGAIGVLRDAPALAWFGSADGCDGEPHLVWPEDQAWCVACEVDEEIEFGVGCSFEAARALRDALPGAVRIVNYGEAAPLYREDPE